MHWEAHLPFLGQSVTFDQELPEGKTNKQTMIHRDGNIFSLEMITRKTDLNEWIVVMIKEKQIELFFIGLRSSFYLDASLLLLVMGPLKSAD